MKHIRNTLRSDFSPVILSGSREGRFSHVFALFSGTESGAAIVPFRLLPASAVGRSISAGERIQTVMFLYSFLTGSVFTGTYRPRFNEQLAMSNEQLKIYVESRWLKQHGHYRATAGHLSLPTANCPFVRAASVPFRLLSAGAAGRSLVTSEPGPGADFKTFSRADGPSNSSLVTMDRSGGSVRQGLPSNIFNSSFLIANYPLDGGKGSFAGNYKPSLYENGASLYKDKASLYKDGLSLYKDKASLYKDGLSLYKDEASLYKDGLSLYKDEASLYKDGLSLYKDGASLYKDGASAGLGRNGQTRRNRRESASARAGSGMARIFRHRHYRGFNQSAAGGEAKYNFFERYYYGII